MFKEGKRWLDQQGFTQTIYHQTKASTSTAGTSTKKIAATEIQEQPTADTDWRLSVTKVKKLVLPAVTADQRLTRILSPMYS